MASTDWWDDDYVGASPAPKSPKARKPPAASTEPEADWWTGTSQFDNVESDLSSTEDTPALPEIEQGSFLERTLAIPERIWADNLTGRAGREVTSLTAEEIGGLPLNSFMTEQEKRRMSEYGLPGPSQEELLRRQAERQAELPEEIAAATARLRERSQRSESLEALLGEDTVYGRVTKALGGFASQAELQALPLVGGAAGSMGGPVGAILGSSAGSIPMAQTAYDSSLVEAYQDFGATKEEAQDYATIMTAIEFAPSALGGAASGAISTAGARLGLKTFTKEAAEEALKRKIRSRTSRVAGALLAEGADEVVAGEGQLLARTAMAENNFFSDPEAQAKLKTKVAEDTANRWSDGLDNFLAGSVGGGITATPVSIAAYSSEVGQRTALQNKATIDGLLREINGEPSDTTETDLNDTSINTTPVPEATPVVPLSLQEQFEADVAAEQAKLETLITPVVEDVVPEKFEIVTELPAQTPPAPTTAPAVDPAEAKQRNSDLGKIHAAKRAAGLDDAAYRTLLKDITGKESAKDLTTEERASVLKHFEKAPRVAPKPGSAAAEIENLAKRLGIDSLSQAPVKGETAAPQVDMEDYRSKVDQINRSLVKGNTQADLDVAQLVRQGKLIIAPNPAIVGRSKLDGDSAATYDIESGKMYLYTDHMDPDAPVRAETLAAAMHEATHGGQFNEREGRSNILKYMMTNDKYDAVNNKIKAAAKSGNTVAQMAVNQAMIAAGMDPATMEKSKNYDSLIEGLEVVPYLATEVARARGKSLGRLGGAVSDTKAALRDFGRTKMGMKNLDFDINELMRASQQTAGELVKTDVKGGDTKGVLSMVGSKNAVHFDKAKAGGRTYKGLVDQKERFEFSDSLSAITTDEVALANLRAGEAMPLGEVLGHQSLYEQYPEAADIEVRYVAGLGSDALFSPSQNLISIGDTAMRMADAGETAHMRSRILHEVQHWVQEKEDLIPGFNDDLLIDPNVRAEKDAAETFMSNFLASVKPEDRVEFLPTNMLRQWAALMESNAYPTDEAKARAFVDGMFAASSSNPAVRALATRYRALNTAVIRANAAYRLQADAAWDAYERDYGETEARNTELRSNITQEDLDASANPNPESSMQYAEFEIPVERTIRALDLVENPQKQAARKSDNKADDFGVARKDAKPFNPSAYRPEVVAWAKNAWRDMVAPNGRPVWQNFVEWFGESQVVNPDGTPMVLYHGTKTLTDFDEFHSDYLHEIGTHVGTQAQASDPRFVGQIYGDTSPIRKDARVADMIRAETMSPRVYPLFVKMENPLLVGDVFGLSPQALMTEVSHRLEESDALTSRAKAAIEGAEAWFSSPEFGKLSFDSEESYKQSWDRLRAMLAELGFDGFKYRNTAEGFRYMPGSGWEIPGIKDPSSRVYYPLATDYSEHSWVVMEPANLKSANNSGDFDGRQRKVLAQARRTQLVYHGTPTTFTNRDDKNPLGKFDEEFMSSGEGQQAVGYGFYFSGNHGVSDDSYRRRLLRAHGEYAPASVVELHAEYIFDMYSDVYRNLTDEMLASAATSMKADAAKLVARIQDNQKEYDNIPKVVDAYMASVHGREEATAMKAMDRALYNEMAERFLILHEMDLRDNREILVEQLVDTESMLEFIDNSTAEQITEIYKKSFQTASASDGELYYVEIPADEDLADWNAPYDKQTAVVKAAWDDLHPKWHMPSPEELEANPFMGTPILPRTFREFYYNVAEELGEKGASKALANAGVLGHKFQPIFGKKWDYHNYVVYEPTHARIVGRDAREKGQTRASMNEWVAEIQLRNKQRIESWVREVQEAREPTGVLSMAAAPVRERKQKKLPVMLRAAFSSSGSTSAEIRAIKEHAASSPSAVRMRAEAFMGQYKKALEKLAKKRGVSEQALSDALTKAIDAIDPKNDLYDENLQAFKDAVRPFGEVGRVLVDFRGMVDNLSMDILRQRAASGKPLSEAERKTYTTVLSNLGRYGHRQFAAHIRDGGFGEAVWDSYLRAKGKQKMTPEERTNAKRVVNALTVLVDQITIPDKAKLDKLSEEKLDKLFATWSDSRNHEALTHDEKREQLDAMRDAINGDGDLMLRQAERIAEEILGLHGKDVGPVASYYRGGKLDLGILQNRKVIDPRIRELMGEIKDPGMRLFTTAAKQSEFVARNKMLIEFTKVNNPYHIQPPGPSGRAAVKGMKQLQGEGFGAMEHYWVSPEFFNLISDQVEQLATFEQAVAMAAARPQIITNKAVLKALDLWAGIAGTTKMLQIIGKPVNFLFNLGGGGRMMLMNGNINPVTLGRAIVTAGELVAYAIDPSKGGERAQRVNAMGITDSAFIGEISSEQYRELRKVIQTMVGQDPSKFKENLRKAGLSVKETYAMMDVVFKIANFYHQADGVLPAFYKAEGIKMTQEEIDRKAADIVSRTNITYKRAAPVIKALERGGITMFGTYFYEVFRTEVENARQGVAELVMANNAKTAKGKAIMGMQAAKRLGGQLTAWGLTYGASQMLADIAFGEGEDDWYARFLMPPFARAKDFIVAGKTKEGIPVLMDWSRFDPAGPASDIMRRIVNGNADPKEVAKEIFGLYIAPRIGTRLAMAVATSVGLDWGNPPEPVVQQVFGEAYADAVLEPLHRAGMPLRVSRAWTTVAESFLPGFIDGFKKSNPKLAETDPYHTIQAVARAGGLYFSSLDPAPQVRSMAYNYKTTLEKERRLLGELVGNFPNLNEETVLRQLTSARTKEYEAFTDLRNVYRGMQAVDMEEDAIRGLLKASKVSGDVISQLQSGEFESSIVSQKSWKAYKTSAMNKAKSDEESEEIGAKWDSAWEILQGVGTDD